MFASYAVFEELVWRVRIERDMGTLGIMGNNGDSGYGWGMMGFVRFLGIVRIDVDFWGLW